MSATGPLVSVCIPTYNRVDFLRRSLATIVRLDYTPLEILISDNCSDDGTETLCREFEGRDPRVRYIRQARNIGLYGNHNFCIRASSGEFICFFHDDDLYDPSIIRRYVSFLQEREEVGLVCSNWEIVDEGGVRIGVRDHDVPPVSSGLEYIERTLRSGRSSVGCPGAMIRRRALEGIWFDEEGPIGFGDFVVWFRIAEQWDVGHMAERLWRYRVHRRSLSRRTVVSMANDYRERMIGYCEEHLRRWPARARRVLRWKRLVDRYLFWAIAYELGLSFRRREEQAFSGPRHQTVFEIADYRLSAADIAAARRQLGEVRRGLVESLTLLAIDAMIRLRLTGPLAWVAGRAESARRVLGLR